MKRLVVVGGSVAGSTTALLFARTGWQVDVVDPEFDRIAHPGPELSSRPGAPHTVQAHGFMARAMLEISTRLPDVRDALVAAGVAVRGGEQAFPPHLYDGGRPDDDELTGFRSRRVTLDRVIADTVRNEPGITVHRERVAGLRTGEGTPLAVTGVTLRSGEVLEADLVVDAAGRRSPVTSWLAALGAQVEERVDPCLIRYYTRHFHVGADEPPALNVGFAEVHEFPHFVQLMFLGDNDTAMLAVAVHDEDPLLKVLRKREAFEALVGAIPEMESWLAVLTPTTDVFCLGAFDNRMRSLAPGGRPSVTGLVQVGDSLAMTNPTRGRGVSMALAAAGRLSDLVGQGLTGEELITAYDEWQRRVLAVYYRETAAVDAALSASLRAALFAGSVPPNAPWVELPDGHTVDAMQLDRAAGQDPDIFRWVLRASMLLDDDRMIASPEVAERTLRVLAGASAPEPEQAPQGGLHGRQTLTALLAPYA